MSESSRIVYRILFVCTGNICRSPMAQAALIFYIPKYLENKVEVLSAGLDAISGLPPTVEAELAAHLKGFNLASHRSCPISELDIENIDIILSMSPEHAIRLKTSFPYLTSRIFSLCQFAGGKNHEIPDPFGGDIGVYTENLKMIETELKRIKSNLWKKARKKITKTR